ncbi:membrane-bound alkaline phosphatase-like [Culicoides brevitarsis]|uniref:membrane-bound alkaline phosphatase-like n=1 Tax=Culicoides brevitarsis TaxID=469753 RepID=UPI00307B388E
MRLIFKFLIAFSAIAAVFTEDDGHHPHFKTVPAKNAEETTSEFWYKSAQKVLSEKLKQKLNENEAKNIIFFIGDGMDFPTTAATRMYLGAEENELSFEKFPHFGLSVNYCVDRKVPDSACSATAYLTGVKANYGTIGVNANVKRYDCKAAMDAKSQTESIVRWAQNAGKATGFVTTTRVTHATPAGVYSSIANRYWENDVEVKKSNCDAKVTDDIAEQLINGPTGSNLNVIMGGGRKMLLDKSMKDDEGVNGERSDGQNFIETWQKLQGDQKRNFEYVWNKTALNKVDYDNTNYLMGLFEADHCRYNLDIKKENLKEEPTLTEMVEAAIKVLKKNKNGYFLFVEGGRIDTAHHDAFVQHALEETAEMARAVDKALSMTNETDTLVVVSADHGHTLTYNGYAQRGNDILGIAGTSDEDGIPYTTLSYANGPGYKNTYNEGAGGRKDPSTQDLKALDFSFPATVPLEVESHGGAHVGVWAKGPFSHIFVGNYEQNAIPYLMAYAGKLGPYSTGSAFISVASPFLLLIAVFTSVRHLLM